MGGAYTTRNGRTSKRGAFVEGIWLCDCDPRLPADKFQTKNGGKNHGRWFYTCQKPQHKRCSFFLWSDEAKVREEAAVLGNSRSEPAPPVTPRKAGLVQQPLTPQSNSKPTENSPKAVTSRETKSSTWVEDVNFEWSSGDDAELLKAEREITNTLPETPRKARRTDLLSSPSKRTSEGRGLRRVGSDDTLGADDDVFATPTTSHISPRSALRSPTTTTPGLKTAIQGESRSEASSLAAEALDILGPARLDPKIEKQLIDLLNRHDLRTQGIAKGRDITRLAVQAKEKRITELQTRILQLEGERETNKTVIAHLKHDILTSPKATRGRGSFPGGKAEV